MKKPLLFFILFVLSFRNYADSTSVVNMPNYYQTIDISANTPCECNSKSTRNEELNMRLLESDITLYNLNAYKFIFGESMVPASKLFYAFEADLNVYKVSFSMETNTFMILTKPGFNLKSFEQAASLVFSNITAMPVADYLYKKNIECYNIYNSFIQKRELEQLEELLNSSDMPIPSNTK
ncbi:MAG: hypothetical protein IT275_01980 [Chitinophagales bacterium]|nr:hypothetical protein [Chitinophagales bacterium]